MVPRTYAEPSRLFVSSTCADISGSQNHDLNYAFSPLEDDGSGPGLHWYNRHNGHIGESDTDPVIPSRLDITVYDIPKYSGASIVFNVAVKPT
jgi:hypothetical protein